MGIRPQTQSPSDGSIAGKKEKVVIIIGATATGKTKLSIDLAIHYGGEIINSDKIQVYKGLDILSNKATEAERRAVPHYLMDIVDDPSSDFTAQDFIHWAHEAITHVLKKGKLPILVGCCHNFIEALVSDSTLGFKSKYEACFLWVDVALPVLYERARTRVDQMVAAGAVDEVQAMFVPGADYDYTKGIWRTIGFRELEKYCLAERDNTVSEETRKLLLDAAVQEIKDNTCNLIDSHLGKIKRLRNELGWEIHRIDATSAVVKKGQEAENEWEKMVITPSFDVVDKLLNHDADADAALDVAPSASSDGFAGSKEVRIYQELRVA